MHIYSVIIRQDVRTTIISKHNVANTEDSELQKIIPLYICFPIQAVRAEAIVNHQNLAQCLEHKVKINKYIPKQTAPDLKELRNLFGESEPTGTYKNKLLKTVTK